MITIRCDKCERAIEVGDDMAGSKVTCPDCGDINVVRPGEAPLRPARKAGSDRATAAGLPPDSGPEQRVMVVRPAMFRAHPVLAAFLFLAMIAGVVGVVYYGLIDRNSVLLWTSVGVIAAGVIAVGVWKFTTLDERLIVTNKRTTYRRGLFSRETTEVLHDDIRNFQVQQSFWNRICGVGEVGISSSGQDSVEIVVRNLPRPRAIQRVIDCYRPL